MGFAAKAKVGQVLARMGYKVERRLSLRDAALDLFGLAVKLRMKDRNGFRFLQIGANDGGEGDPIRPYILRYGWSGVLVEPQPETFSRLVKNYDGVAGLEFVSAALAEQEGTAAFYTAEGADYLGGLDSRSVLRHMGEKAVKKMEVRTISAEKLIRESNLSNADLLQIDTEGFDCKAVKMLFDAGMRPAIVRFEHYHVPAAEVEGCVEELGALGYKVANTGIDMVAVHESV